MGLLDTAIVNAAERAGEDNFELPESRPYSKEEILDLSMHMHYIDWDGIPAPLVDTDGWILRYSVAGPAIRNGTATSQPRLPRRWSARAEDLDGLPGSLHAAEAPPEEEEGRWSQVDAASQQVPRRGPFRSKSVGVSMGAARMNPCPSLTDSPRTCRHPATRHRAFPTDRRLCERIFRSYAPILHEHYRSTMAALYCHLSHLPRNFDEFTSVFAAATFNFGPWTITLPHLDFANLAWGWCAVTALGNFDPDKGGHLILWDLRIVIHFPPGSSILLPSAILRHSNVSIQQGETRYSFTQYTAQAFFVMCKTDSAQTSKSISANCQRQSWWQGQRIGRIGGMKG
ncbi:hypothetical protein B0H13DRAFT_1913881 [Mycena leptocephala]|nr:hypothetical protein B0H13DRAFT_1913881 [Mycena leptocephala]